MAEGRVTVVATGSLAHLPEKQVSLFADSEPDAWSDIVAEEFGVANAAALKWFRPASADTGVPAEPVRCELAAALRAMKQLLQSEGGSGQTLQLFVDRKAVQQTVQQAVPVSQRPGAASEAHSSATRNLSAAAKEILAHKKDSRGRRPTLPWHRATKRLILRQHPRYAPLPSRSLAISSQCPIAGRLLFCLSQVPGHGAVHPR